MHPLPPLSLVPSSMNALPPSPSTSPARPWWRQLLLVACAIAGIGYTVQDIKAELKVPTILAYQINPQATYNALRSDFPIDRHIRFIADNYRAAYNQAVARRNRAILDSRKVVR